MASPVTPDFPRPLATSGKKSPRDILKSPNEYRLSIQANPTVPIVDIYAEAPTPEIAAAFANGAVDGMQDYLKDLAAAQHVPADRRVRLEQFGRAKGVEINPGVRLKLGMLSFLIVFAAASVTVLAVDRVRQGWKLESVARRDAANPRPDGDRQRPLAAAPVLAARRAGDLPRDARRNGDPVSGVTQPARTCEPGGNRRRRGRARAC